jgi:hypothetical protein
MPSVRSKCRIQQIAKVHFAAEWLAGVVLVLRENESHGMGRMKMTESCLMVMAGSEHNS